MNDVMNARGLWWWVGKVSNTTIPGGPVVGDVVGRAPDAEQTEGVLLHFAEHQRGGGVDDVETESRGIADRRSIVVGNGGKERTNW